MTKTCKDCNIEKEEYEFYGLQGECKECTRVRVKRNRDANLDKAKAYELLRTREEPAKIFKTRYHQMKARITGTAGRNSKHKSFGMELMPMDEFLEWCNLNMDKFMEIYNPWRDSGFVYRLTPSIDRKDPRIGYIHGNLQWLPQHENARKGIHQRHLK